jgi:hypothetical protein
VSYRRFLDKITKCFVILAESTRPGLQRECLNPENWNTGGEKSFRDRKSELEPSLNLRHFQIALSGEIECANTVLTADSLPMQRANFPSHAEPTQNGNSPLVSYFISPAGAGDGVMFQICIRTFQASPSRT